jgi:hypothetical protein
MISNSELGSYLLCKATGIFMNFLYFYLAIFKGLKLKQFLKQLNRKKQKRKKREICTGPAGRAGPASDRQQHARAHPPRGPASRQAAQLARATPPLIFSLFFFFL